MDFTYTLTYDGLVWSPTTSAGGQTWQPDGNWGFVGQLGEGFQGYLSYSKGNSRCFIEGEEPFFAPTTSNYQYHDAFGISHHILLTTSACPTGFNFGDGSTSDGSGISFDGTNVHLRNGTAITPPINTGSGSATITDANGNFITNNGNGTFVDTTGTTELTISGAGNAGSPLTFKYPILQNGVSATGTVTVNYSPYTVQTNFGCGITEYSANNISLVDHVTLADSETYSFTYEPTPAGPGIVPGAVTGRLASVTLPGGGTISYTYSGGCSGGINTDGTPATLVRTTSDGQKTYTRNTSGAPVSTTYVSDEKGNETDLNFISDTNGSTFETSRLVYEGPAGGTALESKTIAYNGLPTSTQITPPITQTSTTDEYNGLKQVLTVTSYQSGLPTSTTVEDPSNGNAALFASTTSYNAYGEVLSTQTTDPQNGNAVVTSATYGYDETTPTPTSNFGIPQHNSANGSGGNQTSAHISTGTGTLDSSTVYYDTGVPDHTTAHGFTTTYLYDSTQTFTTQALTIPSSLAPIATSATYDASSGVQISTSDPNNQQTSSLYDALFRPTQTTMPDGGQTNYYYTPTQVGTVTKLDAARSADQETFLGGYGRTKRIAVASDSGSYLTDYCYDAAGLLQYQSYAYQSSTQNPSGTACSSGTARQYTHDALGRTTQIGNPDGSSVSITNFGRATETTSSKPGQPQVSRITQYDLLGRASTVCEISNNSTMPGSGTPQSCGTDLGGTGFVTSYSYNLSAHSTTVQSMQGTNPVQTRVFQADAAGRTTSVTEPESGTTTYTYAYNSTGLLVTRTRPKANQTNSTVMTTTNSQYDSLGRLLSVTYSDGTPTRTYMYDTNSFWPWANFSPANLKGRLYLAYNSSAPAATVYSYDSMGRINGLDECLPSGCGNPANDKQLSFSYDLAGNLTSESDPATGTITFTRSLAGEITSATNQTYNFTGGAGTAALLSNVQNGPYGPTSWQYANGLNGSRFYDSMGRVASAWACSGASGAFCLGGTTRYGFTSTWTGSSLATMCDSSLGQCASTTYDEFGRLSAYTITGAPPGGFNSFSYTYDRWGNRTQQAVTSGSGPSPSYSIATSLYQGALGTTQVTNQISEFSYDAAGNMLNDGLHSYIYDADGNLTAVDGGANAQYTYDALNNKVRWQVSTGTAEVVFDSLGRSTSLWVGGGVQMEEGHIYADGQQIAFRAGDGNTYFSHKDWVNTDRAHTDPNGNVAASFTSLPFGDNGAISGSGYPTNDFAGFGGMDLDAQSTTYQAQFRQYNPMSGRWMSPDPYSGSYSFGNPQSFNRYSYALNSPLSYMDPSGLETVVIPCPPGTPADIDICTQMGPPAPPPAEPCTDGTYCIPGQTSDPQPGGPSSTGGGASSNSPAPNKGLTKKQVACAADAAINGALSIFVPGYAAAKAVASFTGFSFNPVGALTGTSGLFSAGNPTLPQTAAGLAGANDVYRTTSYAVAGGASKPFTTQ